MLPGEFSIATPEGGEVFLRVINAKYGTQMGPDDIPALGIRVLKEERDFNRKAGLTDADDRLPDFFYEEPLEPHNKTVLISPEEMTRTFDF